MPITNDKILIVGAGLCGTLLAIRMAQRGYQVELREQLADMRVGNVAAGRSINLALSDRGLKALNTIGLKDEILKECIPMNGRMIHGVDGSLRLSKYSGRVGEHINSVSRGGLNIALLNKAETYANLTIHFDSKCTHVELDAGKAYFKNMKGETTAVHADVVMGTDGGGSAVRQSMMARTPELLFNYSQNFLPTGYKELSIPPAEDGTHRIEKNALHIWPRGKFMMIALPNLDGSFTVTMFNPIKGEASFDMLDTKDRLLAFFKQYYPDALTHMPTLSEDYFSNPVGVLGTIKCSPWQAFGKALLLGDAAHAVVPFYGQGMNASFEDVRILDETLEKKKGDWEEVFKTFQENRIADANAIADLAIDNFQEMQDKVADIVFIKKRKLEMQLENEYKDYYSKYSLVTFRPELPYSEAMKRGRKQDELLLKICAEPNSDNPSLTDVYQQLKNIEL